MPSLPDDVLIPVFEILHRHRFPHCRLHSGRVEDSPIVLSHVCKQWRHVALSTSRLWSCLHVTIQQKSGYPGALDAFIERARDRPLSVMFICHGKEWEETWDDPGDHNNDVRWLEFQRTLWPRFRTCWDTILKQRRRIQSLAVFACQFEPIVHIQESLQKLSFSKLEYFHLQLHHGVDPPGVSNGRMSIRAPSLKHLRLHCLPIITDLYLYDHLTELVLDSFVCADNSSVLQALARAAPTLQSLTIRIFTFDQNDARVRSFPAITFPRLRSLYFDRVSTDGFPGHPLEDCIRKLLADAPALRIFHCYESISFNTAIIQDALPLSSVRYLTLVSGIRATNHDAHAVYWTNIFSTFHALEYLHVHDVDGVAETLRLFVLMDSHATPHRWPALQTLALPVLTQDEDVAKILLFLNHRLTIGHPIRRVVIFTKEPEEAAIHDPLRNALGLDRLQGLTVEWRNGGREVDALYPWDEERERPRFAPWRGLLAFDDQLN